MSAQFHDICFCVSYPTAPRPPLSAVSLPALGKNLLQGSHTNAHCCCLYFCVPVSRAMVRKGSRLCAGHDQGRRSGHMRSKWRVVQRRMASGSLALLSCSPREFTQAPDPDVAQESANQRVIKLEAALRNGRLRCPEVATLKSLQKARHSLLAPSPRQSPMGRRGWQAIVTGVVQCDPWASSAVGAVATGAEFPSANEGGAQCVSRNTREGFCWSPSFSAELRWRSSSQEWSTSHSRGGQGACTPSCNAVGVSHAVVGCRRSRVGSKKLSRRPKRKRPRHLLQTGFRLPRCMWSGRRSVWRKQNRKFWRPSSVEMFSKPRSWQWRKDLPG